MPDCDDWAASIEFTVGGMAYRREEVLVREDFAPIALERLNDEFPDAPVERRELTEGWSKITGVPDILEGLGHLRRAGVFAQPNHVLFANACCPPHPSTLPPGADPFMASPVLAQSVSANPVLAQPVLAQPVLAQSLGGGCCCCGGGGLINKSSMSNINPALVPRIQATGARRSSARPASEPNDAAKGDDSEETGVRIAILDTGYAENFKPSGLPNKKIEELGWDNPSEDGDQYLDPAAGHGTFIAGVIEQVFPGCTLELHEVLSTYGHGNEDEIALELLALLNRPKSKRPDIVNLSFGGYTIVGMELLSEAVAKLQVEGIIVVASAGNEATCAPTFPAAFPGVVSVGALDQDGWPAEYTNYGPWVRACTIGTDVVSIFFEGFNGDEGVVDGVDIDDFNDGWARWSGTSFAAPRVAGWLARLIADDKSPAQAVKHLIDNDQAEKRPMLGTVVP